MSGAKRHSQRCWHSQDKSAKPAAEISKPSGHVKAPATNFIATFPCVFTAMGKERWRDTKR